MNTYLRPAHILCSTARLARNLQLIYRRDQLQHAQFEDGLKQWQPMPVSTLSQWLQTVIEEAIICGDISPDNAPLGELNPMQESILWEQAIASSLSQHHAEALFDKSGLASAAQEANRLIIEWNLSLPSDELTEETRQFLQWRQRFQALCKQAGMLESVRYLIWQIECIEAGAGQLPDEILLAGFDRQSPLIKRLFLALNARGLKVGTYDLAHTEPQQAHYLALDSQDAECRAAVAWAKQQLLDKPQARIAIVVPELAALRARLSSLLDHVFHPHAVTPALAETSRCYDFSLGTPLSTQPVINAALDLLRLAIQKRSVMQADFSRLLLSPYWSASISEADARARLDANMRQDLGLSFKPSRLMRYLHQAAEGEHRLGVSALHKDIQVLIAGFEQLPHRQLPSTWGRLMQQTLRKANWPGERSVSSYEYQAMQSFDKTLDSIAVLDELLGKITVNEALQRLTQLAQAQIFQVESKSLPPLQMLGMLEASAEPLDAIWVMGMNDNIWPPVARPNALIPASLQRSAGTPNSSSEVQAEYALAIHHRILRSARQIIFSSAAKEGERQLRPSPLMKEIPTLNGEISFARTLAEVFSQEVTQKLEWLDDHLAPAVQAGEHVSGGTGLLKAQAICPAWAFYQYRLNARALREPVNGLDVMERGTLVHAVLAKFWEGRNSAELQAMSIANLNQLIEQACADVLAEFNSENDGTFSKTFLSLEQERLTKLVLAWILEIELQRPQIFSVKACELEQKIEIENISIKLIVDRIDALEDGRLLIIDYKTGRALDYKNWADSRISEPQLPIYAAFVLEDGEVAAVCFAKVRTAENGFAGIAAEEGLLQGVSGLDDKKSRKVFAEEDFPDWGALLQHWKSSITQIALELKSGEASVKFENEKQLAFCEVLPLLRLPERQLQYERRQTGEPS